jgi:ribosomal protein S26
MGRRMKVDYLECDKCGGQVPRTMAVSCKYCDIEGMCVDCSDEHLTFHEDAGHVAFVARSTP